MSSSSERPTSSTSFYRPSFPRISAPATPSPSPTPKPRSASAMSLNNFLSGRTRSFAQHQRGFSETGEVKQEMQREDSSPPIGHLFDSNNTLSFSDTDSTPHKLPVPVIGAARMNAQMKRRGSVESDVIALDVKPSVFVEREEEFFEDGESEVPGGYDVNSDNGYYNGTGDGYEDDSNASMQRDQSYGREEFMDEDSEKSEDEEDTLQQGVQAPGGLWQEDATVSSSLFDNTVGNDAFVAQAPQQPATPVRGKGKEVRIQETSAQPLFSNENRNNYPFRSSRHEYPSRPAFTAPEPAPTTDPIRRPLATAKKPLRLGAQKPILQVPSSQAPPPPNPPQQQPQHDDPDRTIRPTDPTPSVPPPAPAATPYLTDSELLAIPSYRALISHLDNLYTSSRSSPSDLEHELKTLLQYNYASRSHSRPTAFFDALPDEVHAQAGEIIAEKMRGLQERIQEAARKRRRLAQGHYDRVRPIAEEREEKLRVLLERREVLKGGVERLLLEDGFRF